MNLPLRTPDDWQTLLSQTLDDPAELIRLLELPESLIEAARQASGDFPLRIPRPYLSRIQKGDINDPLLKQVLPLGKELRQVPGYLTDPLAEKAANPQEGLIHKYQGRVLLIMTGACAINCRYCFRRHFPYQENRLGPAQWQQLLDYLKNDNSIEEVIFSGGDPLALSDSRLDKLISDLAEIPHIKRLRIHSRLPVVIPQRITESLINLLTRSRLNCIMVLHVNHANEVDDAVRLALAHLKKAGIVLFNQAVLLKGINDSVAALKNLSETLFEAGTLPYYLFVLDPVKGAAHFDIPDTEAQRLVGQLQTQLPGYLVPRLAREVPGKPSKTILPVITD
ncbi:MAG: EF-P beta-lysylation protein EpmB [Pontibacterium sp.]